MQVRKHKRLASGLLLYSFSRWCSLARANFDSGPNDRVGLSIEVKGFHGVYSPRVLGFFNCTRKLSLSHRNSRADDERLKVNEINARDLVIYEAFTIRRSPSKIHSFHSLSSKSRVPAFFLFFLTLYERSLAFWLSACEGKFETTLSLCRRHDPSMHACSTCQTDSPFSTFLCYYFHPEVMNDATWYLKPLASRDDTPCALYGT